MDETDRPRFLESLTMLAETFGETLSAPRIDGYWQALADLPLPQLEQGIDTCLRACRFFPRPAELREACGAQLVSPAWVNEQLSRYLSGHPVDEFVRLFVQRLGGTRAVEDRLPVDRLSLVERLYPGIVAACRARGVWIPTELALADTSTLPLPLPAPGTLVRQ